ncbi:MAG TPA: hypothetical protein VM659_26275 [Dongiaceae bacterium]|nr:hypothetical protein [Dongiaceae bacterium]
MTPPEKTQAEKAHPEKGRPEKKSDKKDPAREALLPDPFVTLPSPIIGAFSEHADGDGNVSVNVTMGIPAKLAATAVNVKVERPSGGAAHEADFVVKLSNLDLATILFRAGGSLFVDGGPFSDDNIKEIATASGTYTDGCKCVIPLDPPCPNGDDQEPFDLSEPLDGGGVNVSTTLSGYSPNELVSGRIVLVVDYK